MQKISNCLYPFFWQHGEAPEILSDYVDKIYESGMRGFCIEARPHPDFLGEGWWHDLDLILGKAKEKDMKVWILDDSHFPTGFANGKIRDCYPEYKKIFVDVRRYDVQGPMRGARINLQLLKGRPWEKPDDSVKILGVFMAKRISQETEEGDPILAETLTEITDQMEMNSRLLTLDIPEGAYSIFCVFETDKRGEEITKDYLNPLVKEATQVLLDEVYEPHYAHYKEEFGKTIQGFFSDEPRLGNVKGTDACIGRKEMVLPWRDGLEEELDFDRKYLPLLWIKADGMESDIRFRYMDLITKLYEQNFTQVLADWCTEHGVWYLGHNIEDNGSHTRLGYGTGHYFRGQKGMDLAGVDVIGGQVMPGMNYHHDAFNMGGSNGEFYHYALAKLASSAAHLDAKKQGRAMCEAFGAYGWNEGLKTMKWIADHLMVRGINYMVPHAFNPKEYADFDSPPHFYAHGHNPQFRYFHILSDYMNRTMEQFRDGKHPAKVGLFYPAEQEWAGEAMLIEKPARELTVHQISFDIITRDYLQEAVVVSGAYIIGGQKMEVLVIPYGEAFPADSAQKVLELAEAGVKICFIHDFPKKIVGGLENGLLSKIRTMGTLVELKELGSALHSYQAVSLKTEEDDLVIGEYEKDGQKKYMFFNESISKNIDNYIKVKENKKGYRYDAFNGMYYPLVKEDDGYLLQLTPYEAAIWVFTDETLDCEQQSEQAGNWSEVALPDKWEVSFGDSFSYPVMKENVDTDQLCCIQNLDGWEEKAGTVAFSGKIELEQEPKQALLDLGNVYETAEVFINCASAGVKICKPYRFDLSGMMRKGENEIRIEVTNTLGTANRDPLGHYMVIEPFGVEGPVSFKVK